MIENSKKPIPVLVSGALGRMGSEVVNTVLNSADCELVAAIDINEKFILFIDFAASVKEFWYCGSRTT